MYRIFLILFIGAYCSKNDMVNLISQYTYENNPKFCVFLLCWTHREKVKFQKQIFSNSNTRTIFIDLQENIRGLDIRRYGEVTFILDFDCPAATEILRQDSECKLFRYLYTWLIISNQIFFEKDIQILFSSANIRFDSRIQFVTPELNKRVYQIFEVYKAGVGVNVKVNLVGVFGGKYVTYFKKAVSFYDARKNMEGVLLRTGNRVNYSFTKEEDYTNVVRAVDVEFQKFNIQLFLTLKDVHKFCYNTTISNSWFGNSTSGIDAGIGKLLYEKKIDISTSGGFMRINRIDYYDFLVPVYKFRSAFIFVNPGNIKLGTEVLKPFSTKTWYAFVLVALAIGSSLYLAYWVEYTFVKTRSKYSLYTSFLITISIIAQQGSAVVPFRFGGRIVFLTLLMMSMIVYNYYTSSLVSSLLSSVPETIHTIKELYESSLKVAIEPQPYTYTYIIQQKDDRYISLLNSTKIYENGIPNLMSPGEGIEKVKQGNYAYHTELATAYSCLDNVDQELVCDLVEINFIPDGDIGMVTQKYSEYTELFQTTLRKMQSSGIYKRETEFWVSKKPVCLLSTRVKAVGLSELFLVFLIMCGGIVLSFFIFLIEVFLHRRFSTNLGC